MSIAADAPGASPVLSSHRLPFLTALYERAEPGFHFMISTFPDKRSRSYPTTSEGIAEAVQWIDEVDKGALHVFASMAIFATPPKSGRGTADDVAALTCLWSDLDVGKVGYARTLDEAVAFAKSIPLPPSLITCSGQGAHALWLLTEPLAMEKPDERADALDLLLQWKATIRTLAQRAGTQVDAGTFDAARVLRVSGTWNPKTRPPTQAYVIESNDATYDVSDIEPMLLDAPELWESGKVAPIDMSRIAVAPSATRPKPFEIAMSQDARLRRTWGRDRKDLDDQSASGYCLSLTDQLVTIGLTDEQIVGLVCQWRAEQGAVEKGADWYARTVGKARQRNGMTSGIADLVEAVESGTQTETAPILDGISQIIGYKIDAIKRYGGPKRCVYRVVIKGSERELGNSDDLLTQKRWAGLLADFGEPMATIKAAAWNQATALIVKAAEDVEAPEELTEAGEAHNWIDGFLEAKGVAEASPQDAWRRECPFWRDGRIAIYSRQLLRWVNRNARKEVDRSRDFYPALRSIGAESIRHDLRSANSGGKNETLWLLPDGYGGWSQSDD